MDLGKTSLSPLAHDQKKKGRKVNFTLSREQGDARMVESSLKRVEKEPFEGDRARLITGKTISEVM